MRARTELLAFEAGVRSAMIENNVAQSNQLIAKHNESIYPVLNGTTKANLANEPELWWDWWDGYNEQYAPPKNTRFWYDASHEYHGPLLSIVSSRHSCFVAGTPVRTDRGVVAIETIQPGDRVLAQDVDSGELNFKTVAATTQRPDAPLLEIVVGEESIVATKGHPFWVNGKGWRMAKRLIAGDVLHTLDGPRTVSAVNVGPTAPAHNLVVDDFSTYFAGDVGILVHDNIPRQPTLALTPGLARQE